MTTPDLSIVVTTRNDNHGVNIMERTNAFCESLLAACRTAPFRTELIVVEWNPPADRAPIADAVAWPSGGNISTRVITVPASEHARFACAGSLPLLQMIAKNVGIRRARAPYILATNVDLIIPSDTLLAVNPASLDANSLYCANRIDVVAGPVLGAPDNATRIRECERNVIAAHSRYATATFDSPVTLDTALKATARPPSADTPKRLAAIARLAARFWRNSRQLSLHTTLLREELGSGRWHTRGCGDFTLMHIDNWRAIEGYWEFDGYSMHVDSAALYAAQLAGLRQITIPFPLYHVEHSGGWSAAGESDGSFYRSIRERGLALLDFEELTFRRIDARKARTKLYSNGPDWGLAKADLAETLVTARSAPSEASAHLAG